MPEPRIATTPMSEACARPWTSRPAKRQSVREKRQSRWTFADLCGGVRGGAGGIRTLDTVLPYTHFPGERLRPLGHRSAAPGRFVHGTKRASGALPIRTGRHAILSPRVIINAIGLGRQAG